MQAPEHEVSPAGHWHIPATQVVPPTHELPQDPQSSWLEDGSTQAPEQLVSPELHVWEQEPRLHTRFDGQSVLHVPQWSWSVFRSTHSLLQAVCPVGHTHLPCRQLISAEQAWPQAAQFASSEVRFTQAPEQEVDPAAQPPSTVPSAAASPDPESGLIALSPSTPAS